tara:strand:+ start:1965 stop:2669 length:705 start_codon:yes stop_codon:yes gene_type:complete
MLLFLVEEQVFTFFHDYKAANIDLPQDVFTSISCLSIDQQYTIEGKTTVRRVGYEIVNNQCIVGDRVFRVLPNGNVDFPINQDCVEFASTSPNYVCDSIKPYAFSIYSAEDYGFLACVRGEPLRDNMPIEYVQGYADGKYRSDCNCEEIGWVVIDFIAIPSEWLEDARGEGYEIRSDVDDLDVVMVCPGSHSEVTALSDLYFVTSKLYSLWEDEEVFAEWVDHEVLSSVFKGGE